MTPETARQLIESQYPNVEQDDIDTYIDGPDDPAAYFAKIADQQELTDDFESFLGN